MELGRATVMISLREDITSDSEDSTQVKEALLARFTHSKDRDP